MGEHFLSSGHRVRAVTPNPSLEATPNGVAPGPLRPQYYLGLLGPGDTPPGSPQLKR